MNLRTYMCTLPTPAYVCALPVNVHPCTCLWGPCLYICNHVIYVCVTCVRESVNQRLSQNPPSSTTSCVRVCLCVLPVVPLNKVHPLPCKQLPSVSLPLGHLSCCFGGWGVETSLQRGPDGGMEPWPSLWPTLASGPPGAWQGTTPSPGASRLP